MDPKLLQQIEEYLIASGLKADELRKRMDAIKASTAEFNRELLNAQRAAADLNYEFSDLSSTFKNVLDDLTKSDKTTGNISKSFKTLGGLADKLKYDALDISILNKKDLESIQKKAQIEEENLRASKIALDNKGLFSLSEESLREQANQKQDLQVAKEAAALLELRGIFDENNNLRSEDVNYVQKLLNLTQKRLEEEENINKTLGISGKIIDGIVGSLGKLGISSEFFEDLKDDMREAAKSGDKWKVVSAGIKGLTKGIGDALKDPVTQLTLLVKLANFFFQAALTANTQSVALGKSLGYGADRADDFREKMVAIESSSNNLNVTTANLTQAFGELATATGFAYEFTADQLETQIKLTKQVGLTADQAAQVQRFGVLNNKTSEETYKSFLKGITATRNQLKVGIDFKATLAEAVMVSGQLAANLGNNPETIAKAIVTAKAFGMTLEQVAKSGESLLNFESSIESELKAELLTGKQLNLERARAAALAGDQISLAEELAKNVGTAAEFTKMNVLQQKALAESVGMTADELANTLRKREEARASGKSLAQVTAEEAAEAIERQSVQDKFNAAMEKLQSIVGNLLAGPLGSFLDLLSGALNIINYMATPLKIIGGIILGIKAAQLAINASKKIGLGLDMIAAKGYKSSISTAAKSSLQFITGKGKGAAEDKVAETAKKASGAGEKAGAGTGKAGDGIKNTLKGISAGIQSFGKVSLGDILKVAGSALALVALTPAIPALLLLQFVNGKAIQSALTGLGNGFKAIGNALSNPKVILGIAVFTLALMGIGKAISFIAPTVEALGTSISNIVTSVASGISSIITSLGDMIVKLGSSLPQLLLLGPALFGISAGLAAMSISGLFALPTIAGLIALGAVAPALASIGIGGGDSKEGKDIESNITSGIDLTPMIAAINEVKTAVDRLYNKDTSINMDGVKVGSTLVKGSYKAA